MPGLERVDGSPFGLDVPDPELQRRRFGVAVQSVYYHPAAGGRVGCAILLRTSFDFRPGEKLGMYFSWLFKVDIGLISVGSAHAVVPLTARGLQTDVKDNEGIDILQHLPHEVEVVRVGRRSDSKAIFLVPNIKATVLGTGIEAGGVGVNTQRQEVQSFVISLRPQLKKFGSDPGCLVWSVSLFRVTNRPYNDHASGDLKMTTPGAFITLET